VNRLEQIARIAAALAVAVFFCSLTALLWRTPNILKHVDGTLTRTEATLSKANATLSNLDKGTKVWADASKEQAADIADTALQVRGTLSAAQETISGLQEDEHAIARLATESSLLVASGKSATDALPHTLQNLDALLDSSRSLLLSGQRTNADIQSLLEHHDAIDKSLQNFAAMTEQSNAILADFRKVADKETAEWLKPVPWWKRPIQKGGALIDIGAAVARHTP